MRYSRTLQHIDLSGMGFNDETLEYITLYGFRKSKTLLSVHMSSNFERHDLLLKFRQWMKVVQISRKVSRDDPNGSQQPPIASEVQNEKAILEVTSSNQALSPADPTAAAPFEKTPLGLIELENMMKEKQEQIKR